MTRNFDRHARRAVFHHSNPRRTADVRFRRRLLLVPVHVPRRPMLGVVIGDRQTRRSGQQFPADRLVENAGNVAIGIQLDAVVLVLERILRYLAASRQRRPRPRPARRRKLRSPTEGALATNSTLPPEICEGTSLPSGPVTWTAFGMPPGKVTLASTTSSRAMFRGLKTTTGTPCVSVSSAAATALGGVVQHAGELVQRDHVVVPGELVRSWE